MNIKEVFNEVNEILLKSMKPSEDIKRLIKEGKFNKEPFNMIRKLEKIDQNPKFHPEGSALNHVLLVVDKASEVKKLSKDEKVFMWSALLHDIGKLTTTRIRKNRITSYNHDIEGAKIGLNFLELVSDDKKFNEKVSKLIRWHMQPLFYDKNLPFFEPQNMLNDVEYKEVALLSYCDRLGRGELGEENTYKEKERIKNFEDYCSKVIE
jgi:putative nucleotidyltransferase with HDIG domain